MIKRGVFAGCEAGCERCEHYSIGCARLKDDIQYLITSGQLQFDRIKKDKKAGIQDVSVITISYSPIIISAPTKLVPLAITKPGPLPYESEKVVPWHYGLDVYYHGVKQEDVSSSAKKDDVSDIANTENIAGSGGMTRSGRFFSNLTIQLNAEVVARAKGK